MIACVHNTMNHHPTPSQVHDAPKNGRKCTKCTFMTFGLGKTACHVCHADFAFRTCKNCTFNTMYGSGEDPTKCHACEAPFEEPPLVVRKSRRTRRPPTTGGCSVVKSTPTPTPTRVCKMCTYETDKDEPNCPICNTPYGDSPYGSDSPSPQQPHNSSQQWVLEFKWICNGCANKNHADDDFCLTCGTEKD